MIGDYGQVLRLRRTVPGPGLQSGMQLAILRE
jgi:hypothetical protein